MEDILDPVVGTTYPGDDRATVPAPPTEPKIEATMLRDTFMRMRRFGRLMNGEQLDVWMVCRKCGEACGLFFEPTTNTTAVICKCTHRSVR